MTSSTLSSSSFSSKNYQLLDQGRVLRNLKPVARRNGFATKFQEQMTYKPHLAMELKDRIIISKPLHNPKRSLNICSYSTKSDNALVPDIVYDFSNSLWTATLSKKFDAFYRFCRPYTVIGTIVGVSSVSLLPLQSMADLSPVFFTGVLKALIPLVLINIYMVGLNQLSDIDIDKINKPDLPLASGEISVTFAKVLTALSCITSLSMGFMLKSPPLLYSILTIGFLATAYSTHLPFMRWKNSAILTSLATIAVRAFVIPAGVFLHIQKYVLGRPVIIPKSLIFTSAFMVIIATVMATIKDIPDEDGDRAHGIQSLTIRLGKENLFKLGVSALLMAYAMAIVVGFSCVSLPNKMVTLLGHFLIASHLLLRARSVEIAEPSSTLAFYMYVWKVMESTTKGVFGCMESCVGLYGILGHDEGTT